MKNLLIKSDNIKGLNYLLKEKKLKGKIDLVYIDPPFATGGNFTITDGRASTISNSKNGDIAYSDTLRGKEFIEFLRERLILIKELFSLIDFRYIALHLSSVNIILCPNCLKISINDLFLAAFFYSSFF